MGFFETLLGSEDQSTDAELSELYFATDLHGSNKCYKKLLNAPTYYDVDTLIIGGDLSGKAIVPVVESDAGWEVQRSDSAKTVEDEAQLEEIEKQIADSGDYPYRMTRDRLQEFKQDTDLVDEKYRELRLERLDEWIELAEEKLGGSDVEVYVIGGNDDHQYMIDRLRDAPVLEFVEDRVVTTRDGYELLGYGWSNPTPWDTPREKPDEGIEEDLNALASAVSDWDRVIANIHCPPYEADIDDAPKLDENLKPQTAGGEVITEPVGSKAIRRFIEDRQPLMGLHGHIHESQGQVTIGETVCINPGSEYSSGYLNGTKVTLSDASVERHQFTSG